MIGEGERRRRRKIIVKSRRLFFSINLDSSFNSIWWNDQIAEERLPAAHSDHHHHLAAATLLNSDVHWSNHRQRSRTLYPHWPCAFSVCVAKNQHSALWARATRAVGLLDAPNLGTWPFARVVYLLFLSPTRLSQMISTVLCDSAWKLFLPMRVLIF